MATPYQIRSLQRSINSFNQRYHLGQPSVSVDSVYGALTDRESKWMQWVLGISDNQVGGWPLDTVINWLAHPGNYYASHPGGLARHVARLKALRTTKPPGGAVVIDGHPVAGWISVPVLAARRDGVRGTVTDGIRTMAEAWWLYTHPEGYPVAYPGRSHHIGETYPDGAVDIDPPEEFAQWLSAYPRQARGLQWAGAKDLVHFSIPGVHRSGEADY